MEVQGRRHHGRQQPWQVRVLVSGAELMHARIEGWGHGMGSKAHLEVGAHCMRASQRSTMDALAACVCMRVCIIHPSL